MATAQKKPTAAKRPVKSAAAKSAAKAAYSATTRSARKPASDAAAAWAKESAKLYQMPFAQGDVGEMGKQAAEKIKETTDTMMKTGSDALQQFWGAAQNPQGAMGGIMGKMKLPSGDAFGFAAKMPEMPNFNPAEIQEKMTKFAHDAAEQISRSTHGSTHATNEAMELSRENVEALVEVCNVAVVLLKELGAEAVNYANKSFSNNVELSKEVLQCRTLNDMFDLGTRCIKTNLDSFFSQSVKFSEKLFQCATEVSEPLNERVSESAERISKAMAA